MDSEVAIQALSALAQTSRLAVFRALVRAGPEGLAAGSVASRLALAPSTLSTHLSLLLQAGLIASRRESRSIIYSARFDRMGELMAFLAEDCCGGASEVCAPVVEAAARASCCAAEA